MLTFVGVVLALIVAGVVAFALRSDTTTASAADWDWPPLTMTYPVQWSSGGTPMTRVRRLTYTSRDSWIEEVISSDPIVTHVGTFSDIGSYQKLENGQYTTYDAVTESTEVETVEDGIVMIPRGGLHPHPIDFLEDLFDREFPAVSTTTKVCFNDVCTDDARGIPVKMGDFVVTEVRVQGEREPVR